ncbi:retinoblastoma-like protein 2 isoform X1 [Psammomys obesus]|uniref:retinoblastoma-like protein 2 isoform X1 n=2 Tax=Psammomys obesus TaxID=48139 RepID=UPI002452FD11|nr:retinoblastoma-like protein 2 isoform X1 [Psammomys obesus]XP_055476902.1 retinoblastoma-like protein 2 isoform X1 [Psammomys obesus]
MASGGNQSPPPPPPAAASSEEEEEDGDAADGAQPAGSPGHQIQQRFEELCSRLNMDEAARAEAWSSYRSMSESYTLEGNDLHWLACALYVACRKSVPTVSKGTVEGNYVSLTRILRCSEQSLIEFFNKMKKWEDMANLPPHFRERTERLERNFTVSAVIFKKYEPIFQDVFKYPPEEQPRQQRGRKQRRQPCTTAEIFHFCWVLFIYAKGNFPMISDDLVNSYHLLLCALDLVYGNALQCSNRKELVNPNFKGLSEDCHPKDSKPSSDPPCVIEKLCSLHDGLVLEAKGIKEHFWKPYIRKLFEKKILKGKEENLTGFLEPGNFGESFKAVNKAYEEYVLAAGNLDERIFLGEDAEEEVGTLSRCLNAASGTESSERTQMKDILQQHLDKSKALRVCTPLTGVSYVQENSPGVTPVSTAAHSLSRLHTMLTGLRNAPSEKLEQILRSCSRDPTQAIASRLKEMYEIYSQHFHPDENLSNCAKETANKHFRFAEMLYYKVLESVIEQEQKRLGDMDLSGVLEQDAFHRSLLTCCLEVVTFSYEPPGNFPLIAEVFDVPYYHFYKVIEVFIRAEDGLCREVVKHLNQIEEQILDHLAWKSDSPLWDRIRENENRVPACEEVMPPQSLERTDETCIAGSPLPPRRVSEVRADAGGLGRSITSPTTLYDRYSSPTVSTTRRRLFENDSPSEGGTSGRIPPQPLVNAVPVQNVSGEAVSVTPVPGQTLVTMATATVTANNGQTVTIPVQGIANENGGITFFPVQVNVGGQAQAVTGSIQPLSAQALTGSLSSQQVTGTTLQVPGQVAIQQISPGGQPQKQGQPLSSSSIRPRKTSSLLLFFRKVYHLAGVRLRDLCAKLDISDELRKKIWTCFEFSLIQCPELMMDRHLDQLLMCAIYVMAKVTKEDKSFQNIMRCYRTQPQARSQVYRSVLIKAKRKRRNSGSSDSRSHQNSPTELNKDRASRDSSPVTRSNSTLPAPQPSSAPPTPTRLTGANRDIEEEERGDLIQFYNNIYRKQIQAFAMKYSQANMDTPPLSPYPFIRTGSPRRIQLSQNHPIYISPHKNEAMLSPRETIFYYFSNSPSKRLREINSMIRTGETPTKKRGILLEDGSESPAKRICPENHCALLRRLQDVANDRGAR